MAAIPPDDPDLPMQKLSLKGALEHQTTVDLRGVENNQQIDDMRKRRNKIVTN